MSNKIKVILVAISATMLIAFFGCAAFQDALTPAYIEPEAAEYAKTEKMSFMPYTTLLDADRVGKRMAYVHKLTQLGLARDIEDDVIRYGFLNDIHLAHIQNAQAFQSQVFSVDSPLGLLMPTLFGGTLGALLIRRPGDKKKEA